MQNIAAVNCTSNCSKNDKCDSCRYQKLVRVLKQGHPYFEIENIQDAVQHGTHVWLLQLRTGAIFIPKTSMAYILETAKHYLLDEYNYGSKHIILESRIEQGDSDTSVLDRFAEPIWDNTEINIDIDLLMCNLSHWESEIIRLYVFDKYRFKEIAEILDISPENARKRYQRAIEKMRKMFD